MENIYEKCVVKPKTAIDNIVTLSTVLFTIGLIVASILIEQVRQYTIAIGIVVIIIAFRLITSRNIEFEYIMAGNSISLDKIMNKNRRKRIINCDLTDFDIVAPVKSKHYDEYKNNAVKTITAVSGDMKDDEYFGLLEYDGKRTLLLFETDERARKHLKRYLEYKMKD